MAWKLLVQKAAVDNIEETIRTSVKTYESTIDGFATMVDAVEFTELAHECFKAS